ncbi:MAG: V-type ATPase subunit [Oscillospiraceae bacterium]|nr:V-type ATPase subunit [Oscillospiraceae bacterium]
MKNNNATVAKIMAIYGKRLSYQDYMELINKQSVSEAAEYLKKNTHYSELLSSIDTNTIHRGMLENLLRRSIFETYIRITGFEHLSNQEFYNYKIIQTEIDEILRCIRYINAKSDKLIADIPVYINNLMSFDLIELAKVSDFKELLVFLKKTPYHNVLKDVSPDKDGKVDVTKCETLLRTYYMKRLKESMHFSKNDVHEMTVLLETDIDFINIINAYRLTAFFGESAESIQQNMLPFYHSLSAAKQNEIFSAPTSEEFIRRFSKTKYGQQIIGNGYEIDNLEQSIQKMRYRYAKRALKRSTSAPLSVYAFIFLLEMEVRNIIRIIEGIRYGIEANKIASLIIM